MTGECMRCVGREGLRHRCYTENIIRGQSCPLVQGPDVQGSVPRRPSNTRVSLCPLVLSSDGGHVQNPMERSIRQDWERWRRGQVEPTRGSTDALQWTVNAAGNVYKNRRLHRKHHGLEKTQFVSVCGTPWA
jgi:hypothetical protein